MILLAVASILATLPVWLAHFPPMTDLPQHAAQVAILRNLQDPNFRFAELFEVNWFTPYLVGYVAVYPFVQLLGIVAACKLVISAALAGVPLSTGLLLMEGGADCYWALLAIPAMYGFAYEWGFLSFLVAAPVGLLFLWIVMRAAHRPSAAIFVTLGMVTLLLFFCHALTCAFFGIIACVYLLLEAGSFRKAVLAMMPMAVVLPIALLWYRRANSLPTTHFGISWDLAWFKPPSPFSLGGRVSGVLPRLLGQPPSLLCYLFGVSLFLLPFLAGARPSRRVAQWVPFAVCIAVLLFFPAGVFGAFFVYQRFTLFALPLFVLGLAPAASVHRLWRVAVLVLVVGSVGVMASRTVRYENEAKGFREILSHMEPNQRALSMVFDWRSEAIPARVYLHYPAWYSATRNGVVDMSFAVNYAQIVRYKPSKAPALPMDFEFYPQAFSWGDMHAGIYRYFVVRAPIDLGARLFYDAPCRVRLAAQSGSWWLYEKDPECSDPARP